MEPSIDVSTGQPLPEDAIQRILFIGPQTHVYNIPPLTSTKGYTASQWTADNNKRLIFTARLRVLETAWEDQAAGGKERLKVDIVLEDPSSGQLFAAAPYTAPAIVEPVLDSSRFFALRVQDPSGRKATLGIGFEDRSEAFDLGVALQEARKSLGFDEGPGSQAAAQARPEEKRDYSLKDGETITINLGGKFGRRRPQQEEASSSSGDLSSFALAPPPGGSGGGSGFLPPPPPPAGSNTMSREQKRRSAQDLGFDDGKFGEFA